MSVHVTYDEQLVMAFYYTGTKAQLVADLEDVRTYLDDADEQDCAIRALIDSALEKLGQMSDQELRSLMTAYIEDGSRLDIDDETYDRVFEALYSQAEDGD